MELLEKQSVIGLGVEGVAFGLFQRAADELEVLTLVVVPEKRRQGLAEALMEKALAQGARKIFLDVAANNTAATRLYEGLGFKTVRVRKAYYATGEDAVVMQKTLD